MTTIEKDKRYEIKDLVEQMEMKHIAIIMDGNRRWAKNRGLPTALGHKKGVDALKATVYACDDFGIKYLTVYAFSTENWNRKPEEVAFLMNLLGSTIKNELGELDKNNVVISFLGDITKLAPSLQTLFAHAVDVTKDNTGVHLQIAVNYGGRDEIVNAVREIANRVKSGDLDIKDINESTVSEALYTSKMPDPDLLIRTGGEQRVSNYLLWQIAYAEFLSISTYWPEFNKDVLARCIEEFHHRQRRWGK